MDTRRHPDHRSSSTTAVRTAEDRRHRTNTRSTEHRKATTPVMGSRTAAIQATVATRATVDGSEKAW